MSEHEFEAYLNLLARTLRLSDAQREQIAGELRDHLEARLDELTDQGIDRHDAILQALDEFGDANVLADDLARPRRQQTRRRIMQTSFATIAAAACAAIAVMYFAPTNRQGQAPQSPAIANESPEQPTLRLEGNPTLTLLDPDTGGTTITAQRLDIRVAEKGTAAVPDAIDLDFQETPLEEVITFFRDEANLNILVDWADLRTFAEIAYDQPITATLRQVDPYVALELVLDTLPPHRDSVLAIERDGVLFVSTGSSVPPSEPEPVVLEQATFDCTRLLELRFDLGLPTSEADSVEKLLRQFIIDTIGVADTRPVSPDFNEPVRSVAVFGTIVTVNQPKPVIDRLRDALDRTQAMLEELREQQADRQADAKEKALAKQREALLSERDIHRAHLIHARQKLDRIQALADSDTAAAAKLEEAQHEVRVAELRLQQLEQRLAMLTP
ncbi:MAG: permease prefix domain 1-containing protein [Planctomycetota bacterium]